MLGCYGFKATRKRDCKRQVIHPATASRGLETPEHDQDNDYKQQKTEAAAAVIAGAVEWPAAKPTKTAKQCNDQNDDKNCAETRDLLSCLRLRALEGAAVAG